jgi:hypothetical protein
VIPFYIESTIIYKKKIAGKQGANFKNLKRVSVPLDLNYHLKGQSQIIFCLEPFNASEGKFRHTFLIFYNFSQAQMPEKITFKRL